MPPPEEVDAMTPAHCPSAPQKPKLLDQVRDALRSRHFSRRTEQSYGHWVKRFIQDIDFARNEILVRDGKGAKDRVTTLPESCKAALQDHLRAVKATHERDLADGWGRVPLPHALERKYPGAPAEWRWQWVFPQEGRWRNPSTGEEGRHHIDESLVQRAVKDAVRRAGIVRRATCHTFRQRQKSSYVAGPLFQVRTCVLC
jgi:hypothetical protein